MNGNIYSQYADEVLQNSIRQTQLHKFEQLIDAALIEGDQERFKVISQQRNDWLASFEQTPINDKSESSIESGRTFKDVFVEMCMDLMPSTLQLQEGETYEFDAKCDEQFKLEAIKKYLQNEYELLISWEKDYLSSGSLVLDYGSDSVKSLSNFEFLKYVKSFKVLVKGKSF